MNETVWKRKEKVWKPRNKQTALLAFLKARPEFLQNEPKIKTPSFFDVLADESKIRQEKIEALEIENAQHEKLVKAKLRLIRENRRKTRKNATPSTRRPYRRPLARKHAEARGLKIYAPV